MNYILSGTVFSCVSHSFKAPLHLAWNSNTFPRRILLVLMYTSSFILVVQVGGGGGGEGRGRSVGTFEHLF